VNENFCTFLTHELREVNDSFLTKGRIRGLEVAFRISDAEHGCEGEITNLLRNHNELVCRVCQTGRRVFSEGQISFAAVYSHRERF